MYSNSFVTQNQKSVRDKSRTAGIQKMQLSEMLGNQSMVIQCCGGEGRTKRKHFTDEEDGKLEQLVKQYGQDHWVEIAVIMEGRTARQCRDRWKHYLHPVTSEPWSEEDRATLERLHTELGPNWKMLAFHFPGRTDVQVKNEYYKIQGGQNKRRGTAFEVEMLNKHLDEGKTLIDMQVPVRSNESEIIAIADAFFSDTALSSETGDLPPDFIIIDFKASEKAGLTHNQKIVYAEIERSGGIVMGGPFKGAKIPKGTKVKIERPK